MPALIAGAAWAAVVVWLLLRVVRQGRLHRAARLDGAIDGPEAIGQAAPRVSIIVPVRNEIANIGGCLGALAAQVSLGRDWVIIVVDDESQDGTGAAVARARAAEPRIRLIRPGALPPGWMGKPYACWCGAKEARTEWLCFIDADVRAAPGLVASALAAAQDQNIDMLSLSPLQELGSFWERLVVPHGLLLIACAMDLRRIDDPEAPEITANGQFLLFRRDAYFAVGGHEAVRHRICEDKAIAGRIKGSGRRFRLLGAEHLARVRMYTDRRSLWEGFAKNAVEILGSSRATVAVAMAGLVVGWAAVLVPALGAAEFVARPSLAAGLGLALGLAVSLVVVGVHLATARHLRVPIGFGLLFPGAYTVIAALAWHSAALRRVGRVRWKGRTYDTKRDATPGPS